MKPESSAVRLEDYRAPDFLVDTVTLAVALDPVKTRVTARSRLRPRGATRALGLAGDELVLISVAIDGKALSAGPTTPSTPNALTIPVTPDAAFELEVVTEINPTANTKLMGLYRSGGAYCTQCEAEGFRRITYFLDRPDVLAVYTTRIEAAKRRSAGAALQRQPGRSRATFPAATATSPSGTTRSRSRPTCSPWSPATSASSSDEFTTHVGPQGRAATSTASTARRRAAPTPWTR